MKKYYMFNFNETKELFIGEFSNDEEFWNYYWKNEERIKEKQNKLDREDQIWHMSSF